MKLLICLLSLISAVFAISGSNKQRIINGQNTEYGEFPYQVQLVVLGTHFCGGVLVSKNFVVTAAHCVVDIDPEWMSVVAGQYNLEQIDGSEQIRGVEKFIIHPDFNQWTRNNDIALIKVSSKFEIDEKFVAPLWIPTLEDTRLMPNNSQVLGWGKDGNSDLAQILQKGNFIIISTNECNVLYPGYSSIICAIGDPSSTRFCEGDNGGPLILINEEKNRSFLGGIVSFGITDETDCISEQLPGAFTKVSDFSDWLLEQILNDPNERCHQHAVTLTPEYTPKGNFLQIDGMDVYEAPIKTWDKMIICVHDIYGFSPMTNNLYQIIDLINEFGFQVVMPDFFRGVPWNDVEDYKKLQRAAWWNETVRGDFFTVVDHYKNQGFTDFGVYGFCWGAKVAFHASEELPNEIKMVGQVHPALVELNDGRKTSSPNLLMPASDDDYMEDYCTLIQERFGPDACVHRRFTDMLHHFAGGVGDWTDPLIRSRAEEVVYLLRREFCIHMGE